MEDKSNRNLVNMTKAVFTNFFKYINDVKTLAALEARLAGKSVITLLILSMVIIALLSTTWLCVLVLFVLALQQVGLGFILSVGLITLLNICLLGSLIFYCLKMKENLYFSATRRQAKFGFNKKDFFDDTVKKTN